MNRSAQGGTDSKSFPQSFDHHKFPQGFRGAKAKIVWQPTWDVFAGVGNIQLAHPSNRAAQADKSIPVKLIGPTEVVDDLGCSIPPIAGTLIVGQLEILGNASVRIPPLGRSQIHAYIIGHVLR